MDPLLILRILTAFCRVVLLVSLLALLSTERGAASRIRRPAWITIAWVHGVFIVGGLYIELQNLIWPSGLMPGTLKRVIYYHLFLLNGLLDAALPILILMLFLAGTRYRRWSLAWLGVIVLTGAAGLALGAVRSWGELLVTSQVLTFQGIVGYLVFFGAYLLKRLPGVDLYLAAFLAVDAVFVLVLPIQQAFFQLVGLDESTSIWHFHQLLQLTAAGIQVVIVLSYLNSMRYRPLEPIIKVRE